MLSDMKKYFYLVQMKNLFVQMYFYLTTLVDEISSHRSNVHSSIFVNPIDVTIEILLNEYVILAEELQFLLLKTVHGFLVFSVSFCLPTSMLTKLR